jgi:two-component system, NarL family, nitrate/nitrite response regulator NarL
VKPIRVLLVDDHALFRSGIKALMSRQPGFEVVGEAGDGLEGVKRATALQPDVVLMDLHMPGMSGREAVKLLAEEVPRARVVMLTVSEDAEDLVETLLAGAHGYLLTNIDIEFLVQGIRRAAGGDSPVSEEMTGKLVQGLKATAGTAEHDVHDPERLTPREREILAMVAQGASNKEIGRDLDLAESTVKIHVRHILRKLNLASRVQAAVYHVEHNIASREL